ncbi:unnamed protein product [Paramecium sonneborni]|uniref:Transmembrane protein n=1 Tax=Paramecium sonneborni TaxID=65129 RepID=A0A8S1RL32_9CILI|nr:unnamed protein product [Paramecium sonneborni]
MTYFYQIKTYLLGVQIHSRVVNQLLKNNVFQHSQGLILSEIELVKKIFIKFAIMQILTYIQVMKIAIHLLMVKQFHLNDKQHGFKMCRCFLKLITLIMIYGCYKWQGSTILIRAHNLHKDAIFIMVNCVKNAVGWYLIEGYAFHNMVMAMLQKVNNVMIEIPINLIDVINVLINETRNAQIVFRDDAQNVKKNVQKIEPFAIVYVGVGILFRDQNNLMIEILTMMISVEVFAKFYLNWKCSIENNISFCTYIILFDLIIIIVEISES